MDRKSRILIVAVVILSILSFATSIYVYGTVLAVDDRVETLEDAINPDQQPATISTTNRTYNTTRGSIAAYDTVEDSGILVPYEFTGTNTDAILIDVKTTQITDEFQESLVTAHEEVQQTKYSPVPEGFILRLDTPERWDEFQGTSASLQIAAEIAAASPHYKLNQSVILTGEVTSSGEINPVGHVGAKAAAASENGKTILITAQPSVPPEQQKGLTIIYVSTLTEALERALIVTEDSSGKPRP